MNKGFADIFLKPLNSYVEYIGLVEFKYINRGKKPPTYLKDGLKLQKVVIVFWGWEMVYCEIYL